MYNNITGGKIQDCDAFEKIISIGFEFESSDTIFLIEHNNILYTLDKLGNKKISKDIDPHLKDGTGSRFSNHYTYKVDIPNVDFIISEDNSPKDNYLIDFFNNNISNNIPSILDKDLKDTNLKLDIIEIDDKKAYFPNLEFHITFKDLGSKISRDIIYEKFKESCCIFINHFEKFEQDYYYLKNEKDNTIFKGLLVTKKETNNIYYLFLTDCNKNPSGIFDDINFRPQCTITCKLDDIIDVLKCCFKNSPYKGHEIFFNEILKYSLNKIVINLTIKDNLKKKIENWIILSLYEFFILKSIEINNIKVQYYKDMSPIILRHYIDDITSSLNTLIPDFQKSLIVNEEFKLFKGVTISDITKYLVEKQDLIFNKNSIKAYTTLFNYLDETIYIEIRNFFRSVNQLEENYIDKPTNLFDMKKYSFLDLYEIAKNNIPSKFNEFNPIDKYFRKLDDITKLYMNDPTTGKIIEVQKDSQYWIDNTKDKCAGTKVVDGAIGYISVGSTKHIETLTCTNYLLDCIQRKDIKQCRKYMTQKEFWGNTKDSIKKEIEDMVPSIAVDTLKVFEFNTNVIFISDNVSGLSLVKSESVNDWITRLIAEGTSKGFTTEEIKAILNNSNLIDYLTLLVEKVNSNPGILNEKYFGNPNENINYFNNIFKNQLITNASKISTLSTKEEILYKNCLNQIDYKLKSLKLTEFLVKPYFFIDQNIINDPTNKFYNLTNNDLPGITSDEILIDSVETENEKQDIFNQKKVFYNFLTDLISNEFIYTDDKQDLVFLFQYLVNNTFNKLIDQYITTNGYEKDQISFLYKGGTVMQILYKKYSDLLNSENNKEPFIFDYSNIFKRSDSDYAINIRKNNIDEPTFQKIYKDMNILTYNILEYIKNYLANTSCGKMILPLDDISPNILKKKLEQINKHLKENKDKLPFFEKIEKFVGISLNNINYMDESIDCSLQIFNMNDDIHSINNINSTDINKVNNIDDINNKYINKINNTNNNINKISVSRNGFFISGVYDKNNKKYFSKTIIIDTQYNVPNQKGIYNYFNQTNNFRNNHFTLHRVKINCLLYFKTKESNGICKYGYMYCPAELIDVPISKYNDYKLDNTDTKKNNVKMYKEYVYYNNKFYKSIIFKSYSLSGFLIDLYGTFEEKLYPWDIDKYEKKLKRTLILFLLYLYNIFYKDKKIKLNNFCYYITKIIEGTDINFTYSSLLNNIAFVNDILPIDDILPTNDKKSVKYTIIRFLTYLKKLDESIKKINPISITLINEYANFKNIILDILANFKIFMDKSNKYNDSKYYNNPEDIPYLKKYLKYKEKYLKLHKKINQ